MAFNEEVNVRRARRRKAARKRHLITGFIIFIVFALIVTFFLSVTVLFPIKNVTAKGSDLYEDSLVAKSADLKGENLFTVSEETATKNIRKTMPFIDSVTIKRQLPDTVHLTVKDAKKYASYKIGKKYYVVSQKGNVLDIDKKAFDNTFVIKTKTAKCVVGKTVSIKDADEKAIIDSLIKNFNKYGIKADEIDVTDKLSIKAKICNRFTVEFGGNINLSKKCAHLNGMLEHIESGSTGTINLSMWTSQKSEGTFVKDIE